MLVQKSPNRWSCLPTAVAIALNVTVESVISWVGHDGSEITHAGLPEPMNRRGFHQQEMIEMCLMDGLAVTQIDLYPCAYGIPKGSSRGLKLFSIRNESEESRFLRHLLNTKGWLDVRTKSGLGHALAYSENYQDTISVVDPTAGNHFSIKNIAQFHEKGFIPVSLFRLDPIEVE